MASLLLSIAGAAAGGSLFGPIGGIVGRLAGAIAGNVIDRTLLGGATKPVDGPRLADLDVMASTEGAPMPRLYGRARLAGQVIWATRLEEVIEERNDNQGGKGFGQSQGGNTYSYFANFAVGLCEGPIGHVARVWADGKLLDLDGINWRFYPGDEAQSPDPLIVAKEGASGAPAYRGLAYVVFERLALENFGNRIPQLSFELIRPIGRLERMTRAVTLIPGTTEFGYEPATTTQTLGPGESTPENRHVAHARSDVEASLDELRALCPNLARVAVVVAWFGSDLRAGHCTVQPGVDNRDKVTSGLPWAVAGLDRAGARLVSTIGGRAAFGGTPSDASVVNLIAALKARGLEVMLYPFVMMDVPAGNALPDPRTGVTPQPAFPWRGHITCDPAPGRPGTVDATAAAATQVGAFFGSAAASDFSVVGTQVTYAGPAEWTLRRMVLHYAHLAVAAGGVDAFLIGSEFKALTRVRAASGVYPAVAQLVALASDVRSVLGGGTAISYGADWTEYGAHVVDPAATEVRFPLDPLWASSAVDFVGIDYYAPLADWRDGPAHLDAAGNDGIYDPGYLGGNVYGGEAFDWFYADDAARAAQARTPITDGAYGRSWMFRVKDLPGWWSQPHYERVGGVELATPTAWSPRAKPIWLTEVGCPAVDKGANQPSVFPDAKSADGGLPHFSNGARDDVIQRRYIEAILATFDPAFGATLAQNPVSPVYGGRMLDPAAIHLWTWDARPYPAFPASRDVWADGDNWETGHWLTGRFGAAPLDALVATVAADAGIHNVDSGALRDSVDGAVIDRPMSPRAALEPLALAFAFEAREDDAVLRFRPRGGAPVAELSEDDLVLPNEGAPLRLARAQETELPRQVTLAFSDGGGDFRRTVAQSRRLVTQSARTAHADLAIVTHDAAAERRAEIWLQDVWVGRETAELALPPSRLAITAGDTLTVEAAGRTRLLEVREVTDTTARSVQARAIDPDVFELPVGMPQRRPPTPPPAAGPAYVVTLDLPSLGSEDPPILTRAAVFARPWPGSVAIWRSRDGASFERAAVATVPSVVGDTLDPLPRGPTSRWDRAGRVRVRLYGGALASASDTAVLGGANAAAVRNPDGGWEILQFAAAELVAERTFMLSRLLRGQAGSEVHMSPSLPVGSVFCLLDRHLTPIARGLDALGRPLTLRVVAAGRDHGDPSAVEIVATPGPTALRPLAPVHAAGWREAGGVRLRWVRRTRRDGDGWEAEVPLAEETEAYAVEILAAPGGAVVRTLEAAAPTLLYGNAEEAADFGAPQAALAVRIAQLSATVGRGFAAEATIGHLG